LNIKCEVRAAALPYAPMFQVQTGADTVLSVLSGVELTYDDANDPPQRVHALQLFIGNNVWSNPIFRDPQATIKPAQDHRLMILPRYQQTVKHRHPGLPTDAGYFNRSHKVGGISGRVDAAVLSGTPKVTYHRTELISASFNQNVTLTADFLSSEWPRKQEELGRVLKEAVRLFVKRIAARE
jgi:hypothetical protein